MPENGYVELRVHGVSGTTATDLLEVDEVSAVAGDDYVQFSRPAPGSTCPTGPPPALGVVEAMSWGKLTSGVAQQAAWLVLLPFAVANLALFTIPPRPNGGARVYSATVWLVRAVALTMTVLLTVTVAVVAVDLVAWQCLAAESACRYEDRVPASVQGLPPSQLIAFATAVPVVVVAVLSWLSTRVSLRYETVTQGAGGPPQKLRDMTLESPGLWHAEHLVSRLRVIHLSVAWVVVGLAVVPYPWAAEHPGTLGPSIASVWAIAVAVVVIGAALWGLGSPRWAQWSTWTASLFPRLSQRAVTVVLVGSGLSAVFAAAVARGMVEVDMQSGSEPSLPLLRVLMALVVVQTGLLLLLLVTWPVACVRDRDPESGRRSHWYSVPRIRRPEERWFAGLTPSLVGSSAVLLGYAFSAVLVQGAAGLLAGEGFDLAVPAVMPWASMGLAAFMVIVVMGGLVAVWHTTRMSEDDVREILSDYQQSEDARSLLDDYRYRRVVRARRLSGALQVDRAFVLLGIGAIVSTVIAGWAVVSFVRDGLQLSSPADGEGIPADVARGFVTAGTWLVGAVVAAVGALVVAAWRSEARRRQLGIAWDVLSFWPRAGHPLAPPSYAERAVPQLAARTRHLARAQHGGLVLSGHSQGSVICVAVVAQLAGQQVPAGSRSPLRGVGLLTHGSPIGRLYEHVFPQWFGSARLQQITHHLTTGGAVLRWHNLRRRTDPLCSSLERAFCSCQTPAPREPPADAADEADAANAADEVEVRRHATRCPARQDVDCRDPAALSMNDESARYPPVLGHSHYSRGPEYRQARRQLSGQLRASLRP